ncbi:MAG: LysM peptidoglycan-binding domain-containing protein [Verrucomicrobiales bacterium]|nr:LysM peptidoglycan-binding domain-containing protein [Verrucomicrobiales bacterium]
MARLKLVLAFFALMILTAGVAGAAYYWQKYVQPQKEVVETIANKDPETKPDLGRKHYDRALAFIDEGELISARNELQYMLEIYPESPTITEAKRVLGELNLDLIFSKIPMEKKSEYHVKSGDAWSVVARRNKTTFDYIMRANGKTTTLIYKGEDLLVYDFSDCEAEIDLDAKTLTVKEGGKFIKEYKILDHNLPSHFPSKTSTSISEKVAWFKDGSVNFMSSNYLHSRKWIRTGKMGLFIRQQLDEDEVEEGDTKPYGVMVAKTDMEELFSILRGGSKVSVLPPND